MSRFELHVQAGARSERVGGNYAGALLVKVRERAIDGAANDAVIRALAHAFGVAPREVQILRGRRSPRKFVEVGGDDPRHDARLAELLS